MGLERLNHLGPSNDTLQAIIVARSRALLDSASQWRLYQWRSTGIVQVLDHTRILLDHSINGFTVELIQEVGFTGMLHFDIQHDSYYFVVCTYVYSLFPVANV
jgi:hypothetical protein